MWNPGPLAAQTISELENMDRGRYSGPVGWIGASGDGEWGVALRCGALDTENAHQMRIFAGCGIVSSSDPASELAESDAKLVPMRSALAPGQTGSLTSVGERKTAHEELRPLLEDLLWINRLTGTVLPPREAADRSSGAPNGPAVLGSPVSPVEAPTTLRPALICPAHPPWKHH